MPKGENPMNNSPVVTIIPATVDRNQRPLSGDTPIKKRVAAYARVSTDLIEQLLNYTAQKEKGVEVFFEKENIYTLDTKNLYS
jgi:hypothetical protein